MEKEARACASGLKSVQICLQSCRGPLVWQALIIMSKCPDHSCKLKKDLDVLSGCVVTVFTACRVIIE